mgnify:CR=1 FL=1
MVRFVGVRIDDTSMLVAAARALRTDAMALCAGASFTFDGAASRLAIGSVEAVVRRCLPGETLLWSLPKGCFLLPTSIAAGTEISVLLGDPEATIMIAGTGAPRAVPMESGRRLCLDEDCWLWISPVEGELVLLSTGIPVPSATAHPERGRVQRARVFDTTGLPAAETVQRALSEADRFECIPKTPTNGLFDPWRDSEYEDDDRYQVLQMRDMSSALRGFMADWLAPLFGSSQFYFQINRYERGDHVLPHRDSLQQGLMMLTGGAGDGLCVQSGDDVVRVPDKAGRIVLCDTDAWHWVDPVRSAPRFTLVTIPAFTPNTAFLSASDHGTMSQPAH